MHDDSNDPGYGDDQDFGDNDNGPQVREVEIREQDRFLPVANIARIMKKVLPNNAKIAKDAKEGIQECLSEFISFITSEASDKCQQEKRKTINGDDLLWAMSALGFDKYIEPLKIYLAKYRESVKGEKPEKKQSARPKEPAFPSLHAQPKGPVGGMNNMMMGLGSGSGGMMSGAGLHAESMGEYGGGGYQHHQQQHGYATAGAGAGVGAGVGMGGMGMQNTMGTMDQSILMAQSRQQQQQQPMSNMGVGAPSSTAGLIPPSANYSDISMGVARNTTMLSSNQGLPIQQQQQYAHAQHQQQQLQHQQPQQQQPQQQQQGHFVGTGDGFNM